MSDVSELTAAAEAVVDDFIAEHRAGAIPALFGACVMWAVMHGGHDVVRNSLLRAIDMADEMQAELKGMMQ
jgi:hypothetical protein